MATQADLETDMLLSEEKIEHAEEICIFRMLRLVR